MCAENQQTFNFTLETHNAENVCRDQWSSARTSKRERETVQMRRLLVYLPWAQLSQLNIGFDRVWFVCEFVPSSTQFQW